MNIAVILHDINDDESDILNSINPAFILKSQNKDKFIAFRDLGLILDKLIYIDRNKIDWILYANNNLIRYTDFLNIESFILPDDNRLFYVEKHNMSLYPNEQQYLYKNFYCRPHVFSILSNVYKLKNIVNELSNLNYFLDITPPGSQYRTDDFFRTWLYAINRNNFNIVNIP
jgi:hypothetical protein